MLLKELETARELKVVMVGGGSEKLALWLKSKAKAIAGSESGTEITVKNKSDLERVKSIKNVIPLNAGSWLVEVDMSIFRNGYGELVELIKVSGDVVYFCEFVWYGDFMAFKNVCEKEGIRGVCEYYIASMQREDYAYLQNELVNRKLQMPGALSARVYKDYHGDVESLMELFEMMSKGAAVRNLKDVAEICGLGGNTVENYVLRLCGGGSMGKRALKNRLSAGLELCGIYGCGRFYRYLKSAVNGFMDLKMLMLRGEENSLAAVGGDYNEKMIKRLLKYRYRLNGDGKYGGGVGITELLRMRVLLAEKAWEDVGGFIGFFYSFYAVRHIGVE